jgi:acetolactate synthase-1/2/3 large subunit
MSPSRLRPAANHPALTIAADAGEILSEIVEHTAAQERTAAGATGRPVRPNGQNLTLERSTPATAREARPDDAGSFPSTNILDHRSWSARGPRTGGAHTTRDSDGRERAFPTDTGTARKRPVPAVFGDGGGAAAAGHALRVTRPIVDDGAYGILREFGVSAPPDGPAGPASDMINSLAADGLRAVAPSTVFRMFAPTHQEVQWRTT